MSIGIFLLVCFTLCLIIPNWADKISYCLGGFLASSVISFMFYELGLVPKIDDFNRRQANLFYFLSLPESSLLEGENKKLQFWQVVEENGKKVLLPAKVIKSTKNTEFFIRLELDKSRFFVKKANEANNQEIEPKYFDTVEKLVNYLWHN